ncbi:HK97 family phage prohead protease [Edaphobacter aggregans]|uniref:HK97 family phage prohead protease n=1 Tax=Edaphobacter aggregans TaxID=570835 RepID=UPI00068CBC92|nr:HK97 family phage prohead protease [Edaphobacter aggregans]
MQRDFSLKLKSVTDAGTFEGIASHYGNVDEVGDVVLPGAYRQSIASQGAGFPLLFAHDQSQPLGLARVSDSPGVGLAVSGSLVMSDPNARRVFDHLKAGSIKGLSVGYSIPNDPQKVTYSSDGRIRNLAEIRLWEVSLTPCPANQLALVNPNSIKSLSQIETVLRSYRPGEVTAADLDQLRSIDVTLKTLLRKDALCECECPECVSGDCIDCSDPDCTDPNCEGTKARQDAEELAALKSLALSLKTIVG